MQTVKMILKVILAGLFVIGLDFVIPFNSDAGLMYLKEHGKWLLFIIAAINTFIGGGISGGFLSNDMKVGFRNWFKPFQIQGGLNPTHAFAGLIAVINVLCVILIEP